MSLTQSTAAYNNITNADLIFPGQKLIVPAQCTTTPDKTSCIKPISQLPVNNTCVKGVSVDPAVYVVIPNDTFTLIANKFNITLNSLEAANPLIPNFDSIAVDQQIALPICQGCSCTNKKYTVVSGDSFSALAQTNGITTGQIESANPKQIPEQLQIGQVINIPVCSCVA